MARERPLDFGTASKDGTGVAMLPPVRESGKGRNQPEQCAGEVDPDGVLHALDVAVAMGILVNVQLCELTCQYCENDGSTAVFCPLFLSSSWVWSCATHARRLKIELNLETYLAKDTEESDPQDKKDCIPGGNKYAASLNDEGDEVESACSCRQCTDYDGIDL